MAANLTTHIPIVPLITVSGNTPLTESIAEKAAQTFLEGVPVQLNAGFVQKWDGATYNAGLLGISNIMASNLATNGAGAPTPFNQIGPPGAIQTWGSVPNQPSGVNIAVGTPITDGRTLVLMAQSDTIFEGMVDNSAGSTPTTYTPVQADVGNFYGLTFDANGYAYVDLGKTTQGTNTCVQMIGLSPVDGSIVNARVRFIFAVAARQLNG
jgi:hypothetical protein